MTKEQTNFGDTLAIFGIFALGMMVGIVIAYFFIFEIDLSDEDSDFSICLSGCQNYQRFIPFDGNNSRIVYFDKCADKCATDYVSVENNEGEKDG